MKCIIFDTHSSTVNTIKTYLLQLEDIDLLAVCNNLKDVIFLLQNKNVDFMFTDVNVLSLSDVELISNLNNKLQYIVTVANSQHNNKHLNYINATCIIEKPLSFNNFLGAIKKVKEKNNSQRNFAVNIFSAGYSETIAPIEDNHIFIVSQYGKTKVYSNDILYIQAFKGCIKLSLKNNKCLVSTLLNLTEILKKLPENFLKVHHSHIVNLNTIKKLQKSNIVIGKALIPVGKIYKDAIFNKLEG